MHNKGIQKNLKCVRIYKIILGMKNIFFCDGVVLLNSFKKNVKFSKYENMNMTLLFKIVLNFESCIYLIILRGDAFCSLPCLATMPNGQHQDYQGEKYHISLYFTFVGRFCLVYPCIFLCFCS